MKKILAAVMATTLTLIAVEPVTAHAQNLTRAQIYQPVITAEVKEAGPDVRFFDYTVDNGANNSAIKDIQVDKASAGYSIPHLKYEFKNRKLTGELALDAEAKYPAQFDVVINAKVTYIDDSWENISATIKVHPVPALVKAEPPANPPAKGNALSSEDGSMTETGRIVAIVSGVIASIAILLGAGGLFMNAFASRG